MANLKNIEIKIRYSIDLETERVFSSIEKMDWYKKMGYQCQIDVPSFKKDDKITKEKIKKAVIKDYDVDDYKRTSLIIKRNWEKNSGEIAMNLLKFGFKPRTQYALFLTKYGTRGSYNPPNKIIIKFRNLDLSKLNTTIIHEMIHLLIEPLIRKFHTGHWFKERIVDLIFAKIEPNSATSQNYPINTKTIDKVFNQFFPDIAKILKNPELRNTQNCLPLQKKDKVVSLGRLTTESFKGGFE